MRHVLITFLGRVPKINDGYRTTVYTFNDGTQTEPVAFIGRSLIPRLKCDKVIILGTAGSMWDHLFEKDVKIQDAAEECRLALVERVEEKCVEQELLDELSPILASQYGCEVVLKIIPNCSNADEQARLLSILAELIDENDVLSLDITHAFRHLPLLVFVAALHLRQLKNIQINQLYYGFYDDVRGQGEVWELGKLMKMVDWLSALNVYQHTGRYGVFSNVVPPELAKPLQEADFYELIGRLGQAKTKIKNEVFNVFARETDPSNQNTDPIMRLFAEPLSLRLAWAKADKMYQRQFELAKTYLQHDLFANAAIVGLEAFISWLMYKYARTADPDNYEKRKEVTERFANTHHLEPKVYEAYHSLRKLRNALAHTSRSDDREVQQAMASPDAMRKELTRLLAVLEPKE